LSDLDIEREKEKEKEKEKKRERERKREKIDWLKDSLVSSFYFSLLSLFYSKSYCTERIKGIIEAFLGLNVDFNLSQNILKI